MEHLYDYSSSSKENSYNTSDEDVSNDDPYPYEEHGEIQDDYNCSHYALVIWSGDDFAFNILDASKIKNKTMLLDPSLEERIICKALYASAGKTHGKENSRNDLCDWKWVEPGSNCTSAMIFTKLIHLCRQSWRFKWLGFCRKNTPRKTKTCRRNNGIPFKICFSVKIWWIIWNKIKIIGSSLIEFLEQFIHNQVVDSLQCNDQQADANWKLGDQQSHGVQVLNVVGHSF